MKLWILIRTVESFFKFPIFRPIRGSKGCRRLGSFLIIMCFDERIEGYRGGTRRGDGTGEEKMGRRPEPPSLRMRG